MKQNLANRACNFVLRDHEGATYGVFPSVEAVVAEAERLGLRGYVLGPSDQPVNFGNE